MAYADAQANREAGPDVHARLVRAIEDARPAVVGTWPLQAGRSLLSASWTDHASSTARLANESHKLLREVSRRIVDLAGSGRGEAAAESAGDRYALLGARPGECGAERHSVILLQLHRSLIHFVWALVLPVMADEMSAVEVDMARSALVTATHAALGMEAADNIEGDVY